MTNFSLLSRTISRLRSAIQPSADPSRGAFEKFIQSNIVRSGVLLTVIHVADYGGGAKTGDAIVAAIAAASAGDTVSFPAGSYSITSSIIVPSDITLQGAPNDATVLNFNLPSAGYGFKIAGGASNVTITSLNMISNTGLIGMSDGNQYTNIHIINNALQFGGGSTSNGTLIFGIYGSVNNDNLLITSNYFHDSPNSVRDWEIWLANNAHLDCNTLYNVVDGGHTCMPRDNVSVSNNYGVHVHRMGQEIQGSNVGTNLVVADNTFYDWIHPYYDSFGLSVVNHYATGTVVKNNYLDADIASGSSWGQADSGGNNRFGYAIEAGGVDYTVDDNIMVGNWTGGVVASRINIVATDNQKYGPANWGDFIGEPSIDGYGSLKLSGNTVNRDLSAAPAAPQLTDTKYVYNPKLDGTPPAQAATSFTGTSTTGTDTGSTTTVGGWDPGSTTTTTTTTTPTLGGSRPVVTAPGGTPTSTPTIAQNIGITKTDQTAIGTAVELDPAQNTEPVVGTLGGLTITPLSATAATITWGSSPVEKGTDNNVLSVTGYEVDIQSTVGKEHFPSVIYSADLKRATVANLHPGWRISFTVTAFMSDGTAYRSGPTEAFFSGDSTAPYTGMLWGGVNPVKTPHG